MSLVLDYFQIYLKRFWDLIVDDFYRKFQVQSLANQNDFNQRNKREEILKVPRGQLFLGAPLNFIGKHKFMVMLVLVLRLFFTFAVFAHRIQ